MTGLICLPGDPRFLFEARIQRLGTVVSFHRAAQLRAVYPGRILLDASEDPIDLSAIETSDVEMHSYGLFETNDKIEYEQLPYV